MLPVSERSVVHADPEFVAAFLLMYSFESPQPFRVEVYDVDASLNGRTSAALDLKRHCDYLGEVEFMLAEMLQDQSRPQTLKLKSGRGHLTVRIQEDKGCKMTLQGTICCSKIWNTGCAHLCNLRQLPAGRQARLTGLECIPQM